jgi:transposase
MAKTYRPYVPEQDLLLPPSLRDWLPEDHLAYFVSDLIDQLDLSAITAVYEDEERGYPPYHPVMLTKVLVYGYCVGVFSSRSAACSKTSRSGCWPRATSRTFARSPIFGRRT